MREKTCFFVSPIKEEGSDERRRSDKIKDHLQECLDDYKVIRADEINSFGLISDDIIEHLFEDELVVADVSTANPNVMYELALRHGFSKDVIEIKEKGTEVPFDIRALRILEFNFEDMGKFKKDIVARASNMQKKGVRPFFPQKVPQPLSMIWGEDQILDFLREQKRQVKSMGIFQGMWCYTQYNSDSLQGYFQDELNLEIKRKRLINTKKIDKTLINDHIKKFQEPISKYQYKVWSTSQSDFEIVIVDKTGDPGDTIAIQLVPNNQTNDVDLAIYSYDSTFVNAMMRRYDALLDQKKLFQVKPGEGIETTIDNWLKQSTSSL